MANDVYAPLRQGVLDIISPIGNFFAGAFNYGSRAGRRTSSCRRTIGQLRAAQAEQGFEQNQLRELMALQNLPFLQSLPTVTAQTVDEYSSNFTATITLDKGRADGVDVGYPVVGAGGPGGTGDPVLPPHLGRAPGHRRAVQGRRDVRDAAVHRHRRRPGAVELHDGGPGAAAHAACSKGEVMFTSGLDAAAFPPGIPVATVRVVPHRRRSEPGDASTSTRPPT